MAKPMSQITIDTTTDVQAVAVEYTVVGDRLSGTVLQNKQVFDAYPDMIVGHFNDLCEYVNTQAPTGDAALSYTPAEISTICAALGCTEASITL